MAEMLRVCVQVIMVSGSGKDSHQVFSALATRVLHLSRFCLYSLATNWPAVCYAPSLYIVHFGYYYMCILTSNSLFCIYVLRVYL